MIPTSPHIKTLPGTHSTAQAGNLPWFSWLSWMHRTGASPNHYLFKQHTDVSLRQSDALMNVCGHRPRDSQSSIFASSAQDLISEQVWQWPVCFLWGQAGLDVLS